MSTSLLEEVAAGNEATGATLAPHVGLAHVTFHGREAEVTPTAKRPWPPSCSGCLR